jgi:hypothetical protein
MRFRRVIRRFTIDSLESITWTYRRQTELKLALWRKIQWGQWVNLELFNNVQVNFSFDISIVLFLDFDSDGSFSGLKTFDDDDVGLEVVGFELLSEFGGFNGGVLGGLRIIKWIL